MEGCSKNGDQTCPQLPDLIPKERIQWLVMRNGEGSSSEEKKLELRLGPPVVEDNFRSLKDSTNRERNHHQSPLSLGYFSSMNHNNNGFSFLDHHSPPSLSVMEKESSQPCCTKVVDLQSTAEKKAFSSPAPTKNTHSHNNSSQKRNAPAPVAGWPPVRSFRKNLASTSTSSKPASESPNGVPNKALVNEKPTHEPSRKSLFVKINMDGVPIGRKVDLKAYDSYEKLSIAVDELFRGLLAAQRDSSVAGIVNKPEDEKAVTGVLDGSGEYTLVYEDNEGDRMLVGDVPWHMFVSTVKRLHVLKSSEVSALSFGSSKQDKILA